MILLCFSLLAIFLLRLLYEGGRKTSVLEVMGVSILYLLGISGVIPFLGREFFGISYLYSSVEIFSFIVAITIIIFGLVVFRFVFISRIKFGWAISRFELFLAFFGILILIRGYLLPIRGWDAFSLYDARALMFLSGMKLSEMDVFSEFDEFNKFYYFSYPPMTSVLHVVMYASNNSHVMIIYALFYVSFIIFVYLFLARMRLSRFIKLVLFILSSINPLIFQHTKLAYTNLPMLSFQFAAFYYIIKFSKYRKNFYLIDSAFLLCFSNWTRSLEPFYIGFFVALLLVLFSKKDDFVRKIFLGVLYFLISMATWVIWRFYVSLNIGNLGLTQPSILGFFSVFYDSLLLSNLLDVIFFIYTAYSRIISYIFMIAFIFLMFLFGNIKRIRIEERVLIIFILVTQTLVLLGTLYFSKTFAWWNQIPDSLLRSNLILIPLASILTGYFLERIKSS